MVAGAGMHFSEFKRNLKEFGSDIEEYPGTIGGCLCGSKNNFLIISKTKRYIKPKVEKPEEPVKKATKKQIKKKVK